MYTIYPTNQLKTVSIVSLLTCIYLSLLTTFVSMQGLLYDIGRSSSGYIIFIIFVCEYLKVSWLNSQKNSASNFRRVSNSRGCIIEILKELSYLCVSMVALFVGIILFGAPALSEHEETMMLSILLTTIIVFPLVKYVGIENSMQLIFGAKTAGGSPEIAMFMRNSIWIVCGSWLGAVVIPLDWNRPWQQWPIPCYLGALVGYFGGNVVTIVKCISPFKFSFDMRK